MAFTVNFYTINKKQNSTALPSGTATAYSCTANEPMDLVDPVIILKISLAQTSHLAFNYCQISSFSRYYWIKTWESRGGLWYAYLHVDPLASFKTAIGNNSLYVYRASYSWDGRIVDNLYPTINRIKQLNISLPKTFSIGGVPYTSMTINTGRVFANVIGSDGTERYAFTEAAFSALVKAIYSDSFYDAILTAWGADQYPEAKVAVNPAQYLSDIKWVPAPLSNSATDAWAFPYSSTVTSIKVGTVTVSPTLQLGTWQAYKLDNIAESVYTIVRDSSMAHPQADARGDWLELSPFSSYEMFVPPFGLVQLDPAAISTHDNINFRMYFDSKAATIQLEVTVSNTGDTRAKEVVIYRNSSNVGIDVPFSAVMTTGTSFSSLINAAMPALVSENPTSIVSGISNMIGKAVDGRIPHVSSTGSFGSAAALSGHPCLQVTHWYMANDDLAGRGRPLCQMKTLSSIPGYIQADPDELHVSCSLGELEEIKAAVAEGFYYE